MDPIILLVIVVFVLLVLAALWARTQSRTGSPDGPVIPDDTFDFDEDSDQIAPTARRKTHIVAPAQDTPDGKRRLDITANALPNLTGVTPPPEKNIDAILVTVLNPSVRFLDSDIEVNDFAPPLTLVVDYKAEDAEATTTEGGKPRLSLAAVYQSNEGWRFERLNTDVTPYAEGGGTLTASLGTLQPNDPVVMCRP
jgi:hypothetical protein